MRNQRIIPGTMLVIIGVLFLLSNFNVIDFDWFSLLGLWPVILIMAGVNLVFANNRANWAVAVKIAVLSLGMFILIWNGLRHTSDLNFSFRNWKTYDDAWSKHTNTYVDSLKPGTTSARLNISAGASKYSLSDTTNLLFAAETNERGVGYTLNSSSDSTQQIIDFEMGANDDDDRRHGRHFFTFGNINSNRVKLKLNPAPVWDINVGAGASKFDLDLSKFKVQKLEFDGGVSSVKVKMGAPLAESRLIFAGGVISITVGIPENTACRITTDTGLSGKHFDGFNKIDDDTFETPGFDKATNKMYISMEGGVSSFRVKRY